MMNRRRLLFICVALCLTSLLGCNRSNRHRDEAGRDSIVEAIKQWEHGRSLRVLRGEALYRRYCEICHSETADGNGFNASLLNPKPIDLRPLANEQNRALVLKVIAEGSVAVGKSSLCPPWGRILSATQREDIFEYLMYLTTKSPPGKG